MMRSLFAVTILFAAACASAPSATLASEDISELDPSVEAEVRSILQGVRDEHNIPGLSVAIAVDGQIVFAQGLGLANLETMTPARADTRYRSASIGKPMTAVAVMRLAEDGLLSLDDAVQEHCPRFPEHAEGAITVRHLLSHQSGVRHYGGPNEAEELHNTTHYDDVADALEIFENDPLVHAPGAEYTYSTFGYDVLGCIIQGATGERYIDVMQRLVFEPAGMVDTLADNPREIIERRAGGYVMEDGALRNAVAVDMSSKLPAGGFLTTALDLARFAIAVQDAELISPDGVAAMFERQTLNDGSITTYGLGWGLSAPDDLFYGLEEVFHGGGTPGVGAMLYMLPERRFAVAIQTNQESYRDRIPAVIAIAEAVLSLP